MLTPPSDVIPAKAGTQSSIDKRGGAAKSRGLRQLHFTFTGQQAEVCLGSRLRGNDGGEGAEVHPHAMPFSGFSRTGPPAGDLSR